jgi:hypothetical protein
MSIFKPLNEIKEIVSFNILRLARDSRIYVGQESFFGHLNPRYHVFKILDYDTRFFCQFGSKLPELTKWCKENNCIYGWDTILCDPRFDLTDRRQIKIHLFIATLDDDAYTLIKLRWS